MLEVLYWCFIYTVYTDLVYVSICILVLQCILQITDQLVLILEMCKFTFFYCFYGVCLLENRRDSVVSISQIWHFLCNFTGSSSDKLIYKGRFSIVLWISYIILLLKVSKFSFLKIMYLEIQLLFHWLIFPIKICMCC